MRSATRLAVVKSGACRLMVSWLSSPNSRGTSRSTTAPRGMRPTVGWFLLTVAAAPPAWKPPTETGPWATA